MKEIISKAKEGDEDSFKVIYDTYWGYVFFISTKLCSNESDAKEVLQDVFFKAFKNIRQLEDETKLKSWLSTITTRECYNRRKKDQRMVSQIEPLEEDVAELNEDFLPEAYILRKDLRKNLLKIINSLPTRQREAVYMYYYMGLKTKEIAEFQNCSEENARKALYDARRSIKNKIEKDKKDKKLPALLVAMVSLSTLFLTEQDLFASRPIITAAAASVFVFVVRQIYIARVTVYIGGVIAALLTAAAVAVGVIYLNNPDYSSYTPNLYQIVDNNQGAELGHEVNDSLPPFENIGAESGFIRSAQPSGARTPVLPESGPPLGMQAPLLPEDVVYDWTFLGWTSDAAGLELAMAANMTWRQAVEAGYITEPPAGVYDGGLAVTMQDGGMTIIAVWGDRYGVIGRANRSE